MKRMRRGSVIIAWVLSYILILAIPLLVDLVSNIQMRRRLLEAEDSEAESQLIQMQNSVETRLDDIVRIARQIGTNSNVTRFLTSLSQEDYPADEFNRIMVDLRSYQSSNSLIEQIYLLPLHARIAVSCGAVIRGKQYDRLLETYRTDPETGAFLPLTSFSAGEVRLLPVRDGRGAERTVVGYMQTLTKHAGSRSDATLLILLNRSSLIPGGGPAERAFFLLNGQNEMIAESTGSVQLEVPGFSELQQKPGRFSVRMDGENYTVLQADSHRFGWKYVLLVPDSLLHREARRTQAVIWATALAAVAAGAVAAVYFSRRNYMPLKDLVSMIESESGQFRERKENEFLFLKKAAEGLSERRQNLETRLVSQAGNLREVFLARLLRHELPESMSIQEGCRLYGITFPSEQFLVLVLCRAGEGKPSASSAGRLAEKERIRKEFERNLDLQDAGYMLDMDGMQTLLISFSAGTEEEAARNRVKELTEWSIKALQSDGIPDLIAASSGLGTGFARLPQMYTDAYTTAEYCILMNRTGLNSHRDIASGIRDEQEFSFYYYPLKAEMQLTNAVKSGEYEQARKVLDELFSLNFGQGDVPREIAQCFMFNLTSTVMRIIYELNLTADGEIGESVRAAQSLLNCHSLPELRKGMEHVIARLTDYIREKNAQNTLADEICAFIALRYADPDLDLTAVADHFSLSPSYLSRKFKGALGIGLPDYINQYRIRRAEDLLRETQDSIQSIAESCGFLNSNTFIRVFRKLDGITPGRYREIHLHQGTAGS